MFTFLGHAAVQGCSRCKKSFPGEIGARDCSGFNREDWNPRENEEHRSQMEKILKCNTAGEKEKMESLYGTRFSVLVKLPYVNLIAMSSIDPMHNLFLGMYKFKI